jgi:hypothetical protein
MLRTDSLRRGVGQCIKRIRAAEGRGAECRWFANLYEDAQRLLAMPDERPQGGTMLSNLSIRRQTPGATATTASVTGAMAVGARILGPSAMGPLALAVAAVGAIAIGRLAIADAVIRKLRAEEIEIGSLKVRELEVAGQRWPGSTVPPMPATDQQS